MSNVMGKPGIANGITPVDQKDEPPAANKTAAREIPVPLANEVARVGGQERWVREESYYRHKAAVRAEDEVEYMLDPEAWLALRELNRAGDDLARRLSLTGTGAVSREEIAHAQAMVTQAQSALNAARASRLAL